MPGFRGHHTAEQLAANALRDIEVLRRYEAGDTLAGIGAVIGLSRDRIRQIVRASGVAMPWDYKCAVTGCETSPRTPNQYCQSHQRRFERYGDPLGTKPRLMDQHGTLASYKGGRCRCDRFSAFIAAVICAAGGLPAAATIRNPGRPDAPQAGTDRHRHRPVDAPPLRART
jgi:hypothetical protein